MQCIRDQREAAGLDEHGFTGYTIVKDYMPERQRPGRETVVPLARAPGHAPTSAKRQSSSTVSGKRRFSSS